MISWLLLLLLFSWTPPHLQDDGVLPCGPQNLTLTGSDHTLLVTWEDSSSCFTRSEPLVYLLTVSVADQRVHDEEVSVTLDRIGSRHSWTWTSSLPLECASHSVSLRPRLDHSSITLEARQTLPGSNSSKWREIVPQDKVFEVGSEATFCCIVPDGETFIEMNMSRHEGSSMKVTKISHQRYALKVRVEPVWDRCVDVKCKTSGGDYGACVYIGYPPDDRDLQCETRDLKSVDCSWNEGRNTNLPTKSPTDYQLNGRACGLKPGGRCSQEVTVEAGRRNWTLAAVNTLGQVELQDSADLMERVHMFAPQRVRASEVNSTKVSVKWSWTVERYRDLNLTCQVNLKHEDTNSTTELSGSGLTSAALTHLIPNLEYQVQVRCGTAQHFWKWSPWSERESFITEGDVPDAVDVWMKMKGNQTLILWKELLANQSHGNVTEYEVSWSNVSEWVRANPPQVQSRLYHHPLSLDTRTQQVVMVRARNEHGSSAPSTITTPSISSRPDETRVDTSRIHGSNQGFSLSWSESPAASCGYVVDWCPVGQDRPVDWLKVPPHQTSVHLTSKTFSDGVRYSLWVYACTQSAPVLLQKSEGYVREKRMKDDLFKSLEVEQQDLDALVSWDQVPVSERTSFILGYNLYYWEQPSQVFKVTSDDPDATSLTARNLRPSFYTFIVTARTAAGECGNTRISRTLNNPADRSIQAVLIPMWVVSGFLFLLFLLCFRHWTCIKQKVYPPIPKPVLTDQWFSSPGKSFNPYLHFDQTLLSEEVMDVPQLHYKPVAPVTPHIDPEDTIKTSKRFGPPTPIFSNLSYDLSTWREGPQSNPGYRSQSPPEAFSLKQDQDHSGRLLSFNSAYILVPGPS